MCDRVGRCEDCRKIFNPIKHKCGYRGCGNCKELVPEDDHKCYVQVCETKGGHCTRDGWCYNPENEKNSKCLCCRMRTNNYIFYDFETMVVETLNDDGTTDRVFRVNYVSTEDYHGKKLNFSTIEDFCKHFVTSKYNKYTFIAHNSRSFDAHFILAWFVENGIRPYCVYRGTSIMFMVTKLEDIWFQEHG